MPSGEVIKEEPHGNECSAHVKEMLLQREVEIEVENIDKAGNFIGYLFVENSNLSLHLVQEGFASMHFTADRSPYANQIKNAEDNAKNAKKRIWTNYSGEEDTVAIEEEERAALNEERKVDYTEVLVTEVTDDGKFYACNVADGTALEKLMDNLREEFTTNPPLAGAYQPKRNDLCAAKFVDDQWYRAKVDKTGSDTFVTAQVGDEDIGKGLVGDGLFLVERKGGRKFAKMLAEYNEAMAKAKRDHLAI